METHDNRNIARNFFQEQDRLRGGPAEELCAPNYTARIGGNPPMDLTGHQQFATAFYSAFPDLYHTVEETLADGDHVDVRFRLDGTQTGDFMGIPATGRRISVAAQARMTVRNGRVEELTGEFDQTGMLQQLGVAPSDG